MNLQRLLKAILFAPGYNGRWGLPAVFIGPPGIGKSSRIAHAAAAFGLWMEVLIASIRMPEDFGGLPVPHTLDNGERVISPLPMPWAPRANDAKRAIVFFDEINTAEPAKQKALLRVVLEGVVGDYILDNGIRFLGAMNSIDEAVDGHDIAPPLANRFGWYQFDPGNLDGYIEYAMGIGERDSLLHKGDAPDEIVEAMLDPAAEERRVLAAWPEAIAKATGHGARFLRKFPEYLHKQPPASDPKSSGAWSSRRTIEFAMRSLASADVHGLDDAERDAMLCAYIGAEGGRQWATLLEKDDLPEPADVLDGRVHFKHDKQRLDRTFAVLTACTALVAPADANKRDDRGKALWQLLESVCRAGTKDVCVPAVRKMSQAGHLKHEESDAVLDLLHDVVAITSPRKSR